MEPNEVNIPRWYLPSFNKQSVIKKIRDIIGSTPISISFDDIENKPTTLAGYGITDAVNINSVGTATWKDYVDVIDRYGTNLPTESAVYSLVNTMITAAQPYQGVSSTEITNGGNQLPTIGGQIYTPKLGDIVAYNNKEFVWESTNTWRELGDEGSYALKTISVWAGTGLTGGGNLTEDRTIGLSSATQDDIAKGVTAYGWGDHSQAGYLTTETDPIFSASDAANISSSDISNWNTAYGWGDHSQVGYLTSETDPTVPNWAKQTNKPTYTASEVGALPDTTFIPTKTSDLNNDSGFITSADIPTNVSAFNNDAGYITSADIPSTYAWSAITNTPTTLSGYGITDANISNGVITLGSNTITPLTSFTETDPTVPSWAKASSKPTYALSEITGTDDLRAIEALSGTSGFLKKTAANTWALDTAPDASTLNGKTAAEILSGVESLKTTSENDAMFTYRQTPSVAVGDSLTLTKIKGKTIVWNQLVDMDYSTWLASSGTTKTYTTNSFSFTATNQYGNISQANKKIVKDHKYLLVFDAIATNQVAMRAYAGAGWSGDTKTITTTKQHFTIKATAANSGVYPFIFQNNAVSDWGTITVSDINFFDLTQMGLDALTAAEFEELYNKTYNQDTGSLQSNRVAAIETVGKNIWDEEWEVGGYNSTTGEKYSLSGSFRCKNLIPIQPNTDYYYNVPYGTWYLLYYDANGNFLSYAGMQSNPQTRTSPSGAYYATFFVYQVATYAGNICINKSNASFNGQYEPYKSNVARLDITTLKVKSPNIWDEEWKGGYKLVNGVETASGGDFCVKNFTPITPSTDYCFTNKMASGTLYPSWYDADKNYLSYSTYISAGTSAVRTSPANAYYMKFWVYLRNTYIDGVTINLSNLGHNGHYYPHGEFAPYSDGMKDAGTAYDELRSKSTTRRMAKVDLGTLNWVYDASQTIVAAKCFHAQLTTKKSGHTRNLMCAKYATLSSGSIGASADKIISDYNGYGNNQIVVVDSAYTDAATFTAAMDGIDLIYEQANPEDFELVTPLDLMIPSDALGTQRLLPENGATPTTAPIVCDFQYGANIGEVVSEVDMRFATVNNAIADILTQLPSSGKAEIPTEAPVNPENTKTYIYYDDINHKICVREKDGTVYSIQLTT